MRVVVGSIEFDVLRFLGRKIDETITAHSMIRAKCTLCTDIKFSVCETNNTYNKIIILLSI